MQTGISEKFGSSGMSFDSIPGYNVKKSRFNLSFLKKGTIDVGEIKLLCCLPCVPNSSHDISLRYLLKSFPLVVPPSTNYKVLTHFYFCSYESLWKGAETFVTKGRSANISLEIPNGVLPNGPISTYDRTFDMSGPDRRSLAVPASLWCDFNLPPLYYPHPGSMDSSMLYLPSLPSNGLDNTGRKMITSPISLLQPFAYQKIYRSNYVSPNLLQNNKVWFPDDISSEEWRIDFNSSNLRVSDDGECLFVPLGSSLPGDGVQVSSSTVPYVGEKNSDGTYDGDNAVNIWQKRYAMFPNDRFMDAKPWLVRGEETTISADVTQTSLTAVSPTTNVKVGPGPEDRNYSNILYSQPGGPTAANGSLTTGSSSGVTQSAMIVRNSDIASGLSVDGVTLSLTANKLRTLMALSIKSEIDALTNGNYNPMISAQFGVDPRHVDYDPYYLGGTVDYIQMNEITQTSASDSSPLGTQGGLARGASQGHICNYFCRDFGFIIGVMIISPDVVYCQGIERQWTDIDQDSVFFPIYNELGFEPIKNQELYISGNVSVDEALYGYTTRNSHMKVNMNQATGFMALPPDVDALFSAYSQTREFSSLPKLSQELLTMSPGNIRRDYLHFTSYPAYRLDFAIDDSGILPLPYSSVPNRMGF